MCIFSGCATNEGNSEKKNEGEQAWQGVITLWDFPRWPDENGQRYGWIEKKIAEFEKSHPGVFINLRKLKWEYGMIELRAAAAAGTYPDMAPVAANFDFIAGRHIEPVDEYFTPDEIAKYDPKSIEQVTYNDRIYGFPWFITTDALFINKDSFSNKEVKVPENGDWTFAEFVQSLQKLSYKQDNKEYKGFNLVLSPGNYQVWGFLTMDGANIFDKSGNFTLNCPEAVSALTKMVELSTKYKVVPENKYGIAEENIVWGDFAEKQEIAVCPAGCWAIKTLSDKQKDGAGFDFDILNYPKGQKEAKPFAQVCAYAIFKQKDPAKKAVCAEFLKYITSEQEQESLSYYGVFPTFLSLQEKAIEEDKYLRKMKHVLDNAQLLPKVKNWYKIDEVVISQLRQAVLTKKSPSEVLEDIERAVQKILVN